MRELPDRLRWAIERLRPVGRKRGIGLLLRRLPARGARGSRLSGRTRPSMAAYLDGTQEPSIDLLRAVAEVTGVSVRWLVLGEGPPTMEARVTHKAVSPITVARVEALELEAAVYLALGLMPIPLPPSPSADADAEVVTRYEAAIDVRAANTAPWLPALLEVQRQLGVRPAIIGQTLHGPLEALRIGTSRMHSAAVDGYVVSMLPVLFALVAVRREHQAQAQHAPRKLGSAKGPKRKPKAGGRAPTEAEERRRVMALHQQIIADSLRRRSILVDRVPQCTCAVCQPEDYPQEAPDAATRLTRPPRNRTSKTTRSTAPPKSRRAR